MKSLISVLLLTLAFITSSLQAQQKEVITLEKAIELALENNNQYNQAKNNLINNKESVLQAKGNFLPNLNANMRGGTSSGFQFNNATGEFNNFIINSISGGINAGMTVFNGFQNIETLRQAENNEVSAQKRLERLREQVIFDTATGFLNILLNRNLLQIAEENVQAQQEQLKLVKEQVNVGSRPIVDQYNQESVVATNELEVIRAENNLLLSETRMIRILQLDPSIEYDFVQPDVNIENIYPKKYDLQELYATALMNRSDLEAQKKDIMSAQNAIAIARSNLYPSISLSAGWSSRYNDQTRDLVFDATTGLPLRDAQGNILREPVGFNDQFFDRNVQTNASVSLQIPIFNNFQVRRAIEQAKVQYKNARLNLNDQELGVMVEVRQAFNDYMALAKEFETNEKALLFSKQNFETTQERYRVGASTLIELTQANAQYVNAQSNSIRTVYNLIFQERVLDFFIGKLQEESINS